MNKSQKTLNVETEEVTISIIPGLKLHLNHPIHIS